MKALCPHCLKLFFNLASHLRMSKCAALAGSHQESHTTNKFRTVLHSTIHEGDSNSEVNVTGVIKGAAGLHPTTINADNIPPEICLDNSFCLDGDDDDDVDQIGLSTSSTGPDCDSSGNTQNSFQPVEQVDGNQNNMLALAQEVPSGTDPAFGTAAARLSNPSIGRLNITSRLEKEDCIRLRLASLFNKQQHPVSDSFADEIMEIFRKECAENDFDPRDTKSSQKAFLERMRLYTNAPKRPEAVVVPIESSSYGLHQPIESQARTHRNTASVLRWNFQEQLVAMLRNKQLFGVLDNLNISEDDPFGMFVPQDGRIGEMMSGALYRRTYQKYQSNHVQAFKKGEVHTQNFFLLPLGLYMDKTGTTAMDRFGLEPVMFTTFLLKSSVRQKTDSAWSPIGFIPDLDKKSKAQKQKEKQGSKLHSDFNHGMSARNYHRCLAQILQQVCDLQLSGLEIELEFGSFKKICHIYLPVFSILGDIKSQDTLTGRIVSHHKSMARLCWRCMCKFSELADPYNNCKLVNSKQFFELIECCEDISVVDPISRTVIYGPKPEHTELHEFLKRKRDQAEILLPNRHVVMTPTEFHKYSQTLRKQYSLNRLDSVLNYLDCGANPHSPFTTCAIDLMHSFSGGIAKQVCFVFISFMSTECKEYLESLIDRVLVPLRSSERYNFPRMNFTKGATNLTLLSCREWVGLLTAITVCCSTYSGEKVLNHLLRKSYDESLKRFRAKRSKEESKSKRKRTMGPRTVGNNEDSGTVELVSENRTKSTQIRKPGRNLDDDEEDSNSVDSDGIPINWDTIASSTNEGIDDEPILLSRSDFVQTSQRLLMMYSFLKREKFWRQDDKEAPEKLKMWLTELLAEMIQRWPRRDGHGWSLSKVHAIFSGTPDHISEFGGLCETDTEVGERGLKLWAKRSGRNTNRQSQAAVTQQTAQNLDRFTVVTRAERMFLGVNFHEPRDDGREDGDDPSQVGQITSAILGNPFFRITFPRSERGYSQVTIKQSSTSTCRRDLHPSVATTIAEDVLLNVNDDSSHSSDSSSSSTFRSHFNVECFARARLSNGKVVICDQNYGGKGPQFDWVVLMTDPLEGHDVFFWNQKYRDNIPNPLDPICRVAANQYQEPEHTSLWQNSANGKLVLNMNLFDQLRWSPINQKKVQDKFFHHKRSGLPKVPADYVVGDLPALPDATDTMSWIKHDYGPLAIPAKVMSFYTNPSTNEQMVVVHTVRSKRLEDVAQSSPLFDKFALQYRPRFEPATATRPSQIDFDQWDSMFVSVPLSSVIDRILAVEENPGIKETLSFNEHLIRTCGVNLAPETKKYQLNTKKRFAMHANRSVTIVRPFTQWGDLVMGDIENK